jgi:hypothetical protein
MRTFSLLATITAAVLLAFAGVSAGAQQPAPDPNAFGPTYKYCKTFRAQGHRIAVYAHRLTCRTARRIQKEYWLGPDSRKVIVNGGSGASGYIKLKRYRGWRCYSGSGGGSCRRGTKVAAYQN